MEHIKPTELNIDIPTISNILLDDISERIFIKGKDGATITVMTYDQFDMLNNRALYGDRCGRKLKHENSILSGTTVD